MDFGPGVLFFSNLLAVWDVSMAGLTELQAEDGVDAEDRNP